MSRQGRDRMPWMLTACFVLPLVTMSILWLHRPITARAASPVLRVNPKGFILPVIQSEDGDGDELLEHWNDPHFSREARYQLGGMGVFFVGVGVAARRRRARMRRFYRAN